MLIEECPVRDKMLAEDECTHKVGRAVRYAISHGILRPYGTFREGVLAFFYQHPVPNGTPLPCQPLIRMIHSSFVILIH